MGKIKIIEAPNSSIKERFNEIELIESGKLAKLKGGELNTFYIQCQKGATCFIKFKCFIDAECPCRKGSLTNTGGGSSGYGGSGAYGGDSLSPYGTPTFPIPPDLPRFNSFDW